MKQRAVASDLRLALICAYAKATQEISKVIVSGLTVRDINVKATGILETMLIRFGAGRKQLVSFGGRGVMDFDPTLEKIFRESFPKGVLINPAIFFASDINHDFLLAQIARVGLKGLRPLINRIDLPADDVATLRAIIRGENCSFSYAILDRDVFTRAFDTSMCSLTLRENSNGVLVFSSDYLLGDAVLDRYKQEGSPPLSVSATLRRHGQTSIELVDVTYLNKRFVVGEVPFEDPLFVQARRVVCAVAITSAELLAHTSCHI
jgi:hypothetical protein